MHTDEIISSETETFHEILRSCVTIFLIFITLLIISHIIIYKFKIKQIDDRFFVSKSDHCAYQVALLTCTFSFSISLAATTLLPLSIISNEIMIYYPKSYYMQWINTSLIQNLWNTVSLSSNITIFILMPFATLFLDSEGFYGLKNNIHNRVMEAICFFSFTLFMILGAVWIVCIPFRDNHNISSSLRDLWHYYLPLVYSSVSLFGVMILCVMSPLGCWDIIKTSSKSLRDLMSSHKSSDDLLEISVEKPASERRTNDSEYHHFYKQEEPTVSSSNTLNEKQQTQVNKNCYFFYLILSMLTIWLAILIIGLLTIYVIYNAVGIVIGLQALPKARDKLKLGRHPSSRLGWFGAAVQIVLIQYLLLSSVWAIYSVFPMVNYTPKRHLTDIQALLKNSMCTLLICSAIPIQSRLLGLTTFNPLGTFGHLDWLDSGLLVLAYNIGFCAFIAIYGFQKIANIYVHKVVLVDSLREVWKCLDSSPKVIQILSNNLLSKNELKTA